MNRSTQTMASTRRRDRMVRLFIVAYSIWCSGIGTHAARCGDALAIGDMKSSRRTPKLIEFGWDEPDAATIERLRVAMSASPFDGCVYHANTSVPGRPHESLTWKGWGRKAFRLEDFGPPLSRSGRKDGKGFDENFLRFNVTPGDLDWFDDHAAVLANARIAATLARGGAGILLDTEQYEGKIFQYPKLADRTGKSLKDYEAQARRRGREVMNAFQAGYPDLAVMLTFGPSQVCRELERGKKSPAECEYGLLLPFVEGMVEAAAGQSRIIDGFEPSYGYLERAQFEAARELIRERAAAMTSDPARYRRVVSAGFGLWLDFDWRKKGWSPERPDENYFSPGRFRVALGHALNATDEYVWIYAETPRWWTADGRHVALPPAYVDGLREARRAARGD
ncbi:hypothetical protein OJF2_22620 [Aquisphaera giovannonii]|uniref:Glycoside hydrolase family 42 N-terminal domain-containing protein n=1 Tax=Aquisphaera giovannonii TaxID=406548 RepID=A0A5B9VZB8_9BACT|nr:hypothetical protein [Aquisphaera giovannonii]QEH33756.1 hypothetical protein OJF2_22620 [Aquisphaera giovannonii]